MLSTYYKLGQEHALEVLKKEAGVGVGVLSILDPLLASLAADKGKKLSTIGGSYAGHVAGTLSGLAGGLGVGGLMGHHGDQLLMDAYLPAAAGSIVGGYKGARAGHGDYEAGLMNILKGKTRKSVLPSKK